MTIYTEGQSIDILLAWVDDSCWVGGTFLAETPKRYKVYCDIRGAVQEGTGIIYVAKHNVRESTDS